MPGNVKDIKGQTFGRATVVEFAGSRAHKALWICRCSCGTEFVAAGVDLRSGNTSSCGCYARDRISETSTTHGASRGDERTGAYRSWQSMKQRCLFPKSIRFANYGGRGIRVCERWLTFENFLADMGERPPGHSLERLDVNGDYEPGNCVWIPCAKQMSNQSKTVRWRLDGEILIQAEVARRLKTHPSCLTHWRRKPTAIPERLHGRLVPETLTGA